LVTDLVADTNPCFEPYCSLNPHVILESSKDGGADTSPAVALVNLHTDRRPTGWGEDALAGAAGTHELVLKFRNETPEETQLTVAFRLLFSPQLSSQLFGIRAHARPLSQVNEGCYVVPAKRAELDAKAR
jgi:hypothetical protein